MEHPEITPAPVSSVDDLLNKMDMLIGATRQWVNDDDDALAALIYRRLSELPIDVTKVHGTPEEAEAFNGKVLTLNKTLHRKAYVELTNLNSLN